MRQLRCRDLKPGDILLRMGTRKPLHQVIQLGQRLAGQPNAFLAHTAIALDTQFVIEVQERGVTANHLAMKNKDCAYFVFRSTNPALGRGAATCARMFFDIARTGDRMKYARIGAVVSVVGPGGSPKTAEEMDGRLDALLAGRNHNFFCSQFVVYVYQLAAYQSGLSAGSIFNMSDGKVSSAVLASLLQGNPAFQEAGYMMPYER